MQVAAGKRRKQSAFMRPAKKQGEKLFIRYILCITATHYVLDRFGLMASNVWKSGFYLFGPSGFGLPNLSQLKLVLVNSSPETQILKFQITHNIFGNF